MVLSTVGYTNVIIYTVIYKGDGLQYMTIVHVNSFYKQSETVIKHGSCYLITITDI